MKVRVKATITTHVVEGRGRRLCPDQGPSPLMISSHIPASRVHQGTETILCDLQVFQSALRRGADESHVHSSKHRASFHSVCQIQHAITLKTESVNSGHLQSLLGGTTGDDHKPAPVM